MVGWSHYYVNTNPQIGQQHEVHQEDCPVFPSAENRRYLGYFSSCHGAVAEAKKSYSDADGCGICSPDCHTA